ncbi:MAG: hypothetical protein O2964_17945 [Verrucomicrobia bacterium]|nr:hypothetical protein [Verrucomicrobiota bacterium]
MRKTLMILPQYVKEPGRLPRTAWATLVTTLRRIHERNSVVSRYLIHAMPLAQQ